MDKHFKRNHLLNKIFNKKSKLSYSCTNKIYNIINSHSNKILNRFYNNNQTDNKPSCNCVIKNNCSVGVMRKFKNVTYQATIFPKEIVNYKKKVYIGSLEGEII